VQANLNVHREDGIIVGVMDGWMDGHMDRRTDEWMHSCLFKQESVS